MSFLFRFQHSMFCNLYTNCRARLHSRSAPAPMPGLMRLLGVCIFFAMHAQSALAQGMNNPQPQEAPRQFKQTCSLCHGSDGRGTDRAPTMVNSAHLQGLSDGDIATIIQKGKGRMPAFPLPAADIATLVRFLRTLNTTTSSTPVAGDPKAGEQIFLGSGQCATCHVARGRGSSNGPDLSGVARRMTLPQITQSLVEPGARIPIGYDSVSV